MVEQVKIPIVGDSGVPDLERELALIFWAYQRGIWIKKQQKYGPDNIAELGMPGLIIRINDKIKRLKSMVLEGAEDDGEGIEDALFDILGYAAMGLLVYRELWPKPTHRLLTLRGLWFVFKSYIKEVL